jgi:hypothetical protein
MEQIKVGSRNFSIGADLRFHRLAGKAMRKCQKAIGPAGSRIRRCGKKAAAKVHSEKRKRWVPVCAKHAVEFRQTVLDLLEYLKINQG